MGIPSEVLERMNQPLPVPSTAIYSRSDGVVAWHSCIDEEAPSSENVKVPGSHIGLLHNAAALYVVADRLAQPPGTHEPFRPPAWLRAFASTGPWRRPRNEGQPMTRMRAMDAAFLAMERPAEPRHLGSVSIFGPGRRGRLTYDDVRALLEERLPLITSAQRVVVDVPFGLGRPSWGPAEGFDLEFHLRHTGLAPPGDAAALGRLIARLHAVPLDRSRPLWELWVIDGLRDDRVALYAKIHMAAIDGVTGAEVMTALLDPDAAGKRHVQPQPPIERPNLVGRVFDGPVDQLRQVARFPGRVASRARHGIEEQLAGFGDTLVETVRRTPGLDPLARFLPRPTERPGRGGPIGAAAPRACRGTRRSPHTAAWRSPGCPSTGSSPSSGRRGRR